MTTQKFSELPISKAQIHNLNELGYLSMTPIQAQSLPLILKGKDIVGQAKTGSGKTAAFGIGLLETIEIDRFVTQGLIICPTRELADQVSKELRRLGRTLPNLKIGTLCGGQPVARQIHSIVQHPPHIVVGTPGRLLDHLSRETLSLSDVKMLVLDEADRMLDMGFAEEMDAIIEKAPKKRQTLLFSATFPDNIRSMSAHIQNAPEMIKVEDNPENAPKIAQSAMILGEEDDKNEITATLLFLHQPESTVIFCNTIRACQALEDYLCDERIDARALHGDLDQAERDTVLLQFSNHSCRVLVATDVAARGLDIKDLSMVINYDLPFDPEVYVHRIGRTGRAGKEGIAINLVSERKRSTLEIFEEMVGSKITEDTPDQLGSPTRKPIESEMITIEINGGKKAKISAGDLLGVLTQNPTIKGADVGKITLFPYHSYVAVKRNIAPIACKQLDHASIKGFKCKARVMR